MGARRLACRPWGKLPCLALAPALEIVQRARRSGIFPCVTLRKRLALSNSNTVPWLVAVIATAIGAGAIGFFAHPYIAGPPAVPAPAQQQQDPATALPPGTTTARVEDWTLICTPSNDAAKPICFAAQDVRTDKGQLLIAILAGYEAQGQRAFLVRAPLGVQLDQGLIFQMSEEKPAAFAFTACSDVSCDAQLIVPDGNFEKLDGAGSFTLAYIMADGTPVKATVSMKGLGKAYESIIKPDPVAAPAPAVEGPAATPAPETPAPDAPAPTPKPATP